jgi:uncharacterized protein YceK
VKRPAIALLAAMSLTGCGTVFNFGAGTCPISEYPSVYGGVGIDVGTFAVQDFPLGLLLALIDFPLSLAADTVTLPYTIPATIAHAARPPRNSQPPPPEK